MSDRSPQRIIGEDAFIQLVFEGYAVVRSDTLESMRELSEAALMAYSETQPDEETRMAQMIAPISELADLLSKALPLQARA